MYAHGRNTNRLYIRKIEEYDKVIWKDFLIHNPSLLYLGIELNKTPEESANNWIDFQFKQYAVNGYGHHTLISK